MQTTFLPEQQNRIRPLRLKDLPHGERPRERLAWLGPQALSGAELLAVLLVGGTAEENALQLGTHLLLEFGGFAGLHGASFDELVARNGVGPARACQLLAAFELGRRLSLETPEEMPCIRSPADAAALVQYEMSAMEQEHLRVIFLNTRNRVLGWEDVYRGTLNQSHVRVGEVFKSAIRKNAASIIIAHNHPSGTPDPSPDDLTITRALVEAGRLLDCEVLDHLVIGRGRYVSLKERKLGFD